MAHIRVKGRPDPLVVDDALAKKIKERKFGTDKISRAEPNEQLDITHGGGEWSGEYGRISEIDISKSGQADTAREEDARREREAKDAWLGRSPASKAQELGWYKLCYSGRTGNWKWEPSPALQAKVIAFQEKWYTEHPRELHVPSDDYGVLLPARRGITTLAEKFRVLQKDGVIKYPSA